jgi:hypothetical protein
MVKPFHQLTMTLRFTGVGLVTLFSTLMFTDLRCWAWGYGDVPLLLRSLAYGLLLSIIFVLPFAFLPLIGLNRRVVIRTLSMVLFSIVIIPQFYAGIEEYRYVRHIRMNPPKEFTYQARQRPFETNWIGYNPQTDTFVGGD